MFSLGSRFSNAETSAPNTDDKIQDCDKQISEIERRRDRVKSAGVLFLLNAHKSFCVTRKSIFGFLRAKVLAFDVSDYKFVKCIFKLNFVYQHNSKHDTIVLVFECKGKAENLLQFFSGLSWNVGTRFACVLCKQI